MAPARQHLRALIRQSGLSVPLFAKLVMARNPRTVERWLAGDSPISPVVVEWLERAKVRRSARFLYVFVRL